MFLQSSRSPWSSSLLETTEQQVDREIPGSPSLPPCQQCSLLFSMDPGTPAAPQSGPASTQLPKAGWICFLLAPSHPTRIHPRREGGREGEEMGMVNRSSREQSME